METGKPSSIIRADQEAVFKVEEEHPGDDQEGADADNVLFEQPIIAGSAI